MEMVSQRQLFPPIIILGHIIVVYVLLENRISATSVLHSPKLEHLWFQQKWHKLERSNSQKMAGIRFVHAGGTFACNGLPLPTLEL